MGQGGTKAKAGDNRVTIPGETGSDETISVGSHVVSVYYDHGGREFWPSQRLLRWLLLPWCPHDLLRCGVCSPLPCNCIIPCISVGTYVIRSCAGEL